MTKTESAIRWMESKANDNRHGYDQKYRWGEKGDYDCSSATITAWEQAGVPVKTKGAVYTGNIYDVFIACGFKDVTVSVDRSTGAGLQRGDVLLNKQRHVAMYCGNGMEVEASINEKETVTGGVPGDQTGKEFLIREYRNYPWDCVLRYSGSGEEVLQHQEEKDWIEYGDTGDEVKKLQEKLNKRGYGLAVDGFFGPATLAAVKDFQSKNGLTVDGLFGPKSKAKLDALINSMNSMSKSDNASLSSGSSLNKTSKWTGSVTGNSLNVRTWAGVEYPNIKSRPTLDAGDRVGVCGTVKDSNSEDWYYVCIDGKYYGFVKAEYIVKMQL